MGVILREMRIDGPKAEDWTSSYDQGQGIVSVERSYDIFEHETSNYRVVESARKFWSLSLYKNLIVMVEC